MTSSLSTSSRCEPLGRRRGRRGAKPTLFGDQPIPAVIVAFGSPRALVEPWDTALPLRASLSCARQGCGRRGLSLFDRPTCDVECVGSHSRKDRHHRTEHDHGSADAGHPQRTRRLAASNRGTPPECDRPHPVPRMPSKKRRCPACRDTPDALRQDAIDLGLLRSPSVRQRGNSGAPGSFSHAVNAGGGGRTHPMADDGQGHARAVRAR